MARYAGPVCRLCRRQGEKLFLKGERCMTPKCAIERRPTPPGQRGRRRQRVSDRGIQLREKQKARHIYGILERQLRRHFAEGERRPGHTGENLLKILEMRLDNVVYRLGFADSRKQARHLVQHGHFTLNGRKTDIPSCAVKPGDTIAWMEGSTKLEYYKIMVRGIQSKPIPDWLSLDMQTLTGRVLAVPSRGDMESLIDENVVVEYYSR